jgi:hypothetical protein
MRKLKMITDEHKKLQFDFANHKQIPPAVAEYVTTVLGLDIDIAEVSIVHINSFLNGLENNEE